MTRSQCSHSFLLFASTTSTLQEPICWVTASTACSSQQGFITTENFGDLLDNETYENTAQKSLPSFFVKLFPLFPHYCHLRFARLAGHKARKPSEAHLGR